ncbi:arabinofuranan 3-O-arabinosyltransferase [Actinophytocola oryzae]|uniref:Arabinofuranan 3-O-arabinosyltransferase n=1 Tax=Actinophytocola oryzae TaxID=502181 RepID=A0A4R7UXZ6_9PSEU|nr:arabinofuranan 3-O-arabinosyltransferase [Actinophytocola oryzae]
MLATVRTWPRNPAAWVMALLTVVSFLQRPGRTTFDTKLDLVVDPLAFLGRALHLWNPEATAGELQNQAYGYLFPMGPFFAGGQLLGLPPWVTQRLWCALLLCVAFGGMLALARALNVGSEPARFAGALGYAVAPRMLTEIGPLSSEMLPAALLPWVLLPLVRANRIGSTRRAAGLSALAVLCMGGINASVVLMALVLPGLWLVTRRWTREHVALVSWWVGSVAAVCLWWILPLLLLGEYSMPFLNYIESATNTTAPMSLFEVLRGTNQWVAYVVEGTPWWPSGFMLIDNPLLMLATGMVAAIGLYGLARHRLPERRFLVLATVTGLVLLTIGYVGVLDSPFSTVVRTLLDGPLAPFRNVHKFEPVLRLPLMLAFTHALTGRLPGLARAATPVVAVRARLAIGVLLVALTAAPAWLFTLRPGPGWTEVPGYWHSAMTWLSDQDGHARTLLLPGTGFGEYTWGRTIDEPAQALAESPWGVRSQVPLGSEGNTRLMDAVEDVLSDGRGSPALAGFLNRGGYRFLLLRNDIDRTATDAPPVEVIRAGLARSTGVTRVATFGPLEIYSVGRSAALVSAVSTSDVATVSGGPESLLPLLESGALGASTPTVLAGDGGLADSRDWLVTDGLRHRERNIGRVRDNLSQTLAPDEAPRQDRPSTDVLPFDGTGHLTTAAYRGVRGVTASTSVAFADAVGGSDPSGLPFAAVDGDPLTSWRSSSFTGPAGQWLEVELDTPRTVPYVDMSIVDDIRVGWPVTRIRLTTDAGSVESEVATGPAPQRFPLPKGVTSRVRVTVLSVAADRDNGNVGVSELTIPGVTPQRMLTTPPDATPAMNQRAEYVFTRGSQPRYACVGGVCDAGLTRAGEEPGGVRRLFATTSAANYRLSGTVLPALGGENPVSLPGVTVSASSQLAGDPTAGALSSVDGNPSSAWRPDVQDLRPTLRLSWGTPRALTGLRLTGARLPTDVEITVPQGVQTVPVHDGVARFSLTTGSIEVRLIGGSPALDELRLLGMDLPAPPRTFTVPCGQGPAVTVDGVTYATSVSGSLADYLAHRPLGFRTCEDLTGGLDLPSGRHEVATSRSPSFVVQDLWLLSGDADRPTTRATRATTWDVTHRSVEVGAGSAAVLSVPENANPGWVAHLNGEELRRVRVDGWQQAWLVPAGRGGTVTLDFAPDGEYRTGLLVGGLAAAALVLSLLIPTRRRARVSVQAGGERWVPVVLVVLLAVLGGMLPAVLLIACLLVRALWPPAPRWVAVGAAGLACLVAVSGRVLRNGQEWAHGPVAQALLLLAVASVVAGCVEWFAPRAKLDHGTRAHERPGGDDGGGDDLREGSVEPAGDEDDLDRDRAPDQQR